MSQANSIDVRAEQLGLVAELMCRTKTYRTFPIACLDAWVIPAINHRQIFFAFDREGRVVGYFTWAFLAPDVELRLINDPNVLFHYSEWNEGRTPWIMDMVAPSGHALDIMHFIRNNMFENSDQIKWLRRNEEGAVRHVSSFKRKKSEKNSKASPSNLFRLPKDSFAESRQAWMKNIYDY